MALCETWRPMRAGSSGERRLIKARLAEWIGIDPRALAAFRIGMAAILLVDLAIRAGNVAEFYAEGGFFPFEAARRWHGRSWAWSLHLLDGSAEFQSALMVLAALFSVAMLLGYRTTLTTIGSWVMLVSLHNRTPLLLNGGDVIFRMLLFWGMFLPLGRAWSVDALRRSRRRSPGDPPERRYEPVVSMAGAALLAQLCLMYFCTGLFKHNRDWLSGDSMYYVFSFDAYGRPLGRFLLQFPLLCRLITWGTLWLELLGPPLMLLPWPWVARWAEHPAIAASLPRWLCLVLRGIGLSVRPMLAFAFIGMHVGIESTITVGLFSYVCIAGLLLFLPPAFWDGRVLRFLQRTLARVLPVLNRDDAEPRHASAASLKMEPVEAVAASPDPRSGWPRLAFGVARGLVCFVLLGFVIWYNIATLQKKFVDVMPRSVSRFATPLVIAQRWNMFSRPTRDDGWFVARATLADGKAVDLLRGGAPVDVSKPADVAGVFPNHRWRKFYRQLIDDDGKKYRDAVARYLGKTWNERHDGARHAVSVELLYYREKTLLDPKEMKVERVELARVEMPRGDSPAPTPDEDDAQDASGAAEVASSATPGSSR